MNESSVWDDVVGSRITAVETADGFTTYLFENEETGVRGGIMVRATLERPQAVQTAGEYRDVFDRIDLEERVEALRLALQEVQGVALNGPGDGSDTSRARLNRIDAIVCEALGPTATKSRKRDEMVCDRCHRRHGVVWFAPSDIWNAVMREGDRGKPDEFSFCCPICFMQLAEARGVVTTGWRVAPEERA